MPKIIVPVSNIHGPLGHNDHTTHKLKSTAGQICSEIVWANLSKFAIIVFWKFLLVVGKKDQLIYNLMMGLEYLTEGEGLSCRRWPHITTTLNMSTPIRGIRSVV